MENPRGRLQLIDFLYFRVHLRGLSITNVGVKICKGGAEP